MIEKLTKLLSIRLFLALTIGATFGFLAAGNIILTNLSIHFIGAIFIAFGSLIGFLISSSVFNSTSQNKPEANERRLFIKQDSLLLYHFKPFILILSVSVAILFLYLLLGITYNETTTSSFKEFTKSNTFLNPLLTASLTIITLSALVHRSVVSDIQFKQTLKEHQIKYYMETREKVEKILSKRLNGTIQNNHKFEVEAKIELSSPELLVFENPADGNYNLPEKTKKNTEELRKLISRIITNTSERLEKINPTVIKLINIEREELNPEKEIDKLREINSLYFNKPSITDIQIDQYKMEFRNLEARIDIKTNKQLFKMPHIDMAISLIIYLETIEESIIECFKIVPQSIRNCQIPDNSDFGPAFDTETMGNLLKKSKTQFSANPAYKEIIELILSIAEASKKPSIENIASVTTKLNQSHKRIPKGRLRVSKNLIDKILIHSQRAANEINMEPLDPSIEEQLLILKQLDKREVLL